MQISTGPLAAFDAAVSDITQRRAADYGDPLENFSRITRLQGFIADCPDPVVRHALDMILVKVARLANTPDHLDSVIDIAGYARTIAMVLDGRQPRPLTPCLQRAGKPFNSSDWTGR